MYQLWQSRAQEKINEKYGLRWIYALSRLCQKLINLVTEVLDLEGTENIIENWELCRRCQ